MNAAVLTALTRPDHVAAEALFASNLQPSDRPDDDTAADSIAAVLERLGCDGCAAHVASEFGEHPDQAVARMRWALSVENLLCTHQGIHHPHQEPAMIRRWCTTTNQPGGKDVHQTLDEAIGRAEDLADRHLTGASTVERLTIWFDDGDGRGWQSLRVIDIAAKAARYRRTALRGAA